MMKLLSAPASPFGRKVKMAAAVKGLSAEISVETVDTSPPENPAFDGRNPLKKIPVLILDDGTTLYDSRVIVEYLDSLTAMPLLIPPSGTARFDVLRRAALADGLMEAALLVVYESRFRPEDRRSDAWLARQQAKITTALKAFEDACGQLSDAPDAADIGLAAALGYLDLRHEGLWRTYHPRLVRWLDGYADRVPSFAATAFRPA